MSLPKGRKRHLAPAVQDGAAVQGPTVGEIWGCVRATHYGHLVRVDKLMARSVAYTTIRPSRHATDYRRTLRTDIFVALHRPAGKADR